MSTSPVTYADDQIDAPLGYPRAAPELEPERKARSTRTGIKFDPLLPFETWQALGVKIGTYANATGWWMGDWLNYGQQQYGRRYKDAIAITGLEYQTLRNCAAVARRFELSRRRDDVSFQHHAEVCALEDKEQDRWLARAASEGWSRNELRRRVRASLADPSAAPPTNWLRFAVDPEDEQRWREAADREQCQLDQWIVDTLQRAAGLVVD